MEYKSKIRQELAWQPEPAKNSDMVGPYNEGKILPSSPDEEIELPMMHRAYTSKQLKRINRYKQNKKFKQRKQQIVLANDLFYEGST